MNPKGKLGHLPTRLHSDDGVLQVFCSFKKNQMQYKESHVFDVIILTVNVKQSLIFHIHTMIFLSGKQVSMNKTV